MIHEPRPSALIILQSMSSLAGLHSRVNLLGLDHDHLVTAATWRGWAATLIMTAAAWRRWPAALKMTATTWRGWAAALAHDGMINRCSVDLPYNGE